MIQHGEALTLRTYPFGEADKIGVFLTRDWGRLRGIAYGARKSRTRFGSGLEPLSYVRLTFRRKEGQELAVVENCEIIQPSPAYRVGWEQNLHLGYFAELLLEFSREQAASERVFRLALAAIDAVGDASMDRLARYFEFWMLRLEGVLPSLDTLFPAELALRTASFLKLPPTQLTASLLTDVDLRELERVAEKLVECHLERPLKAKQMLKELL